MLDSPNESKSQYGLSNYDKKDGIDDERRSKAAT